MPPSHDDLAAAVAACRADDQFLRELANLYADVDATVSAKGPVCLGGGACCRFDVAGHRLYVSTGELALLTECTPPKPHRAAIHRCPYQVATRCAARAARCLGCRVFFCDAGLDTWCTETYETFHRAIRNLHDAHDLPYVYVELTAALTELAARRR